MISKKKPYAIICRYIFIFDYSINIYGYYPKECLKKYKRGNLMVLFLGQRKVRRIRYTLLISLPAVWAKNAKIEPGSSMNIELMPDNSLRITPSSTGPPRTEIAGCATPN